jgi:hypothetical protein
VYPAINFDLTGLILMRRIAMLSSLPILAAGCGSSTDPAGEQH